ncbi:SDR family NAD(P)-dependent oxidoreductase [Streptomyces sp. NPDC056169]|uniref:SDR family NAD(P)-dependent oxidoreductase n=1 Tax=Streptomyces sp. NPDC056169 TaxID=3345734 RepID=UPI0035DED6D3
MASAVSLSAGHIITLSSSAGIIGQEFCVAYAASKFGVEGWMESLRYDVEPYKFHTTIVEPGFFRTELLVDASTTWPEPTIDDYAERTTATIEAWKSMNGQLTGDPVKLARALLTIAGQAKPLQRFVAGADAIDGVKAKAQELLSKPKPPSNWAATWPTTTPMPEQTTPAPKPRRRPPPARVRRLTAT